MTTASQIESHEARASIHSGRSDGDRMFRRAMRHSRLVRTLRIGVPLSVVIAVGVTFVIVSVLDPLKALVKLPIDISGLVVSGSKITMQAPRLVGYTRDNRPYALTARAAAQDITKPDVVELQDVRATMETQGRGSFEVLANTGVYDSKADSLTLRQNIVVTSAAYEGHLSEAHVDVRKGYLLSEKPVQVQMQQGTINANRLEVENSGDVIRFGRGVTMVMQADAAGIKTADAAPDDAVTGAVGHKTADAVDRKTGGQ